MHFMDYSNLLFVFTKPKDHGHYLYNKSISKDEFKPVPSKVWTEKNATGLKYCHRGKGYNLCRMIMKVGQNY